MYTIDFVRKIEKQQKEIEQLKEQIKTATMQVARRRFDDAIKTLQEALKETK